MDYKTKRQRIISSLGIGILVLMACTLFTETIPLIENTAVPFIPGNPTATPLGSDITDPNFVKGVEAFYNDNFEETITLMNMVIESDPDLAPPYRFRGGALGLLGDCTAGLADAKKAISLEPDYAAAWAIRGVNYGCLGNEQQELEDYEKALSLDPSLSFVHYNLGVYYYNHGDYERSLDEYGMSALIDPTRSGAWGGMAQVLSQVGQYDECITHATKAIKINAEGWLAYSIRGVCEELDGDHWAAITDFKTYLEHNPMNAEVWYNLGTAQYHADFNQEATDSLSRALELDPARYPANINRGLAYMELQKYNEALNDFNHALEIGETPAAYSGRGTAYYWLGRYDEAITDLELARSMTPNHPQSYCMLALAYFEVGRYQESVDSAAIVNQIDPECGGQKLLTTQARAYYELGDYEQAISYMNQSMEVQEFIMGFYYRGTMYQAAEKNEEAISDFEIFLKFIPPDDEYQDEIADAKARLEQLKKITVLQFVGRTHVCPFYFKNTSGLCNPHTGIIRVNGCKNTSSP